MLLRQADDHQGLGLAVVVRVFVVAAAARVLGRNLAIVAQHGQQVLGVCREAGQVVAAAAGRRA